MENLNKMAGTGITVSRREAVGKSPSHVCPRRDSNPIPSGSESNAVPLRYVTLRD